MLSGIPNADLVKMTAILSMDDVLIYQVKQNSATNPIFDVKDEKWMKKGKGTCNSKVHVFIE